MARIFPQHFDSEAPKSEQRVFAALRDHLSDDYVVFHSQRINTLSSEWVSFWEGEADFIVFHPAYGYVVVEVKGGGIGHDENGWSSVDRNGVKHQIKDPGQQAQRQSRAIDRYLRSHSSYSGKRGAPPFEWAVCFSDMQVDQVQLLELPKEKVIDRSDLQNGTVKQTLDSILSKSKGHRSGDRFNSDIFIRSIAPSIDLIPRLRDRMEDESLDLVRLTERQQRLIKMMRQNGNVAIRGGAGTGKTMLSVERARRLVESGETVLLLCYNQSLAEYLVDQVQGVDVMTFQGLCRIMAEKAGIQFNVPADHERQRIFWRDSVQYILDKALELLPETRWDHVIIDEGQDFMEHWWSSVLELKKDESSTLWVLYDPNQILYHGVNSDIAEHLGLIPCVLDENCRNTKSIGRRVKELMSESIMIPDDAPEGEEVVRVDCQDSDDMVRCVQKELHRLISTEGISPSSIVVLSPRLPETSDIWNRQQFGNLRLRLMEEQPEPNTIRFSSLHRFKGLEADVVILCEVIPGSVSCQPNHLYVGCSRARHKLLEFSYENK